MQKKSPVGLIVGLIAGVLVLAVIAVGGFLFFKKEPTQAVDLPSSTPSPSAPADPDTKPAPELKLPDPATEATGDSGWTMQISKKWVEFDIPDFEEEAAWATGKGSDEFNNNVNVLTETPAISVSLPNYVKLSAANLTSDVDAEVVDSQTYDAGGRLYGRVEYKANISGIDVHSVVYIVKIDDTFILATYTATPKSFAEEAPKVEPYLATLQ